MLMSEKIFKWTLYTKYYKQNHIPTSYNNEGKDISNFFEQLIQRTTFLWSTQKNQFDFILYENMLNFFGIFQHKILVY